jgi:hypothetical protein
MTVLAESQSSRCYCKQNAPLKHCCECPMDQAVWQESSAKNLTREGGKASLTRWPWSLQRKITKTTNTHTWEVRRPVRGRPSIGVAKCSVVPWAAIQHRVSPPQATVGTFKASLSGQARGLRHIMSPSPQLLSAMVNFFGQFLLSLLSAANWKMGWCKLLCDML